MKGKLLRGISIVIFILLALVFVVKFAGPPTLRLYVEAGIGSCQKIPILCAAPSKEIINPEINEEYIAQLVPYRFPEMGISVPKDFTVIKERIKKVYYKKHLRKDKGAVSYLLYNKPGFFTGLFPQTAKQGVSDDYEFLKRTMYATPKGIKNLTDAFFVIMKGIFTPDLGDQKNLEMVKFTVSGKKGFLNYNLGDTENYFDCNIIDEAGNFFKVYIKDKGAALNPDKVLAIISTVNKI